MSEGRYWRFDRFGVAEDVMRLERTRTPAPGPGEVAVAIRAVGINQAENRYLEGTHFPPPRLPACIGHEAVGEVVLVGPGVGEVAPRWRPGDRVALAPMRVDIAGMGALREIGVYPQSALLPVAEGLTDSEAAACWMALFTLGGAMDRAGIGPKSAPGKTILVTAATGGVGTFGLQLARAWGARTIATTRSTAKASLISAIATHVVLARTPEDLVERLRSVAPDGVDVVLDPLGGPFVRAAVEAMRTGGQYVGYEMIAGEQGEYDVPALLEKDICIRGHTIFRLLRDRAAFDRLVAAGADLAGSLKPIVAETFPFEEAPMAFAAMRRSDHVGKIVVTV